MLVKLLNNVKEFGKIFEKMLNVNKIKVINMLLIVLKLFKNEARRKNSPKANERIAADFFTSNKQITSP